MIRYDTLFPYAFSTYLSNDQTTSLYFFNVSTFHVINLQNQLFCLLSPHTFLMFNRRIKA